MKKITKSISLLLAVLLMVAFAGCTKEIVVEEAPAEKPAAETPATEEKAPESETPAAENPPASPQGTSEGDSDARKIVETIVEDAKQGKVIQSDVACQGNIDDVKSEWGEPNSDTVVSAAKGTFCEYTEKGVVFGYNNESQIFEVRRVAGDVLEEFTFGDIKAVLGDPQYTSVDANQNPEYGYQVSDDYKIIFVMDEMGDNSGVEHYNVLWPQGSENLMAGDMGKEW